MECDINLFINLVKVIFQLSNTCIHEITTLAISKLEKGGKSKQLIVLNRQTLYGTNKGGKDKITDFGETWVG